MQIQSSVAHSELQGAVQIVQQHYKDPAFLNIIRGHGSFNHTRDSGVDVANKIQAAAHRVFVQTYKSWNPYSRCIASTEGDTISFNSRKLKHLTKEELVTTVMHECLHTMGYRHKTNFRTDYNLQTVPYKVAELFVEYLKKARIL